MKWGWSTHLLWVINLRKKQTRSNSIKEFLEFIILHYTDTWLLSPSPPFSISAPPLWVLLKKPRVPNEGMHFPKFLVLLNFEKSSLLKITMAVGSAARQRGDRDGDQLQPITPSSSCCQAQWNTSAKEQAQQVTGVHGKEWITVGRVQ